MVEGQHLHGCSTQPQSDTESDDQMHEIGPFQMPPIKRNELRAVYARILAAGNIPSSLIPLRKHWGRQFEPKHRSPADGTFDADGAIVQ